MGWLLHHQYWQYTLLRFFYPLKVERTKKYHINNIFRYSTFSQNPSCKEHACTADKFSEEKKKKKKTIQYNTIQYSIIDFIYKLKFTPQQLSI